MENERTILRSESMTIKLKYGYFIEVDEKNFTLKSKYISKKNNKETTRTHGYYSNIDNALHNYIKLATLDVNSGAVIELQDLLIKIKVVCDETVKTIKSQFKKE